MLYNTRKLSRINIFNFYRQVSLEELDEEREAKQKNTQGEAEGLNIYPLGEEDMRENIILLLQSCKSVGLPLDSKFIPHVILQVWCVCVCVFFIAFGQFYRLDCILTGCDWNNCFLWQR